MLPMMCVQSLIQSVGLDMGQKPGEAIEIKLSKLDIPDNLSTELERLHDMIKDNSGTANNDNRKWAMDKIAQIHKILFHPTYVIGSTFSGVGQNER